MTREQIEELRTLAEAANCDGYYVQEDSDLVWRLPVDAKGPRHDDVLDAYERAYADAVLQPGLILDLIAMALGTEVSS